MGTCLPAAPPSRDRTSPAGQASPTPLVPLDLLAPRARAASSVWPHSRASLSRAPPTAQAPPVGLADHVTLAARMSRPWPPSHRQPRHPQAAAAFGVLGPGVLSPGALGSRGSRSRGSQSDPKPPGCPSGSSRQAPSPPLRRPHFHSTAQCRSALFSHRHQVPITPQEMPAIMADSGRCWLLCRKTRSIQQHSCQEAAIPVAQGGPR